jgi:hypothetical protein
MNREEVRQRLFAARTLEECTEAETVLAAYLEQHPDDWDLRDEAESLIMRRTARERLLGKVLPTEVTSSASSS